MARIAQDPEVRRRSPIFEAVDVMSWREELQYWARPPVPTIPEIIRICGEEFHDMLRGIQPARTALQRAQARADALKAALVAGGVPAGRIQASGRKAPATAAKAAEVAVAL